jgi:PhnB protein|tara:strand:+ start:545 stop:970 length:426 start_codon:yes stop_codon:yes gene_type:complete
MAQINPYLVFNGNCEAAFNLYKSVFRTEFQMISRFSEMPPQEGMEAPDADGIMHVSLPVGNGVILMGSDNGGQGEVLFGDSVNVSITVDSEEEAKRMFEALSENGIIKMPLEKTFWNSYFGMLVDEFGIHWMVSYDYPTES